MASGFRRSGTERETQVVMVRQGTNGERSTCPKEFGKFTGEGRPGNENKKPTVYSRSGRGSGGSPEYRGSGFGIRKGLLE